MHVDVKVYEDTRQASREHAQDATEMLQEKNREIEWLRAQKAADDVSKLMLRFKRMLICPYSASARQRYASSLPKHDIDNVEYVLPACSRFV